MTRRRLLRGRTAFGWPVLCAVIFCFWLGATGVSLLAAAPAQPQPAAGGEDFGQYLASHQDDLAPFFSSHSADLIKQAIPLFFAVMGNVLLLNLIIGWIIDVAAGRCFSIFFAPGYAKIKPAILYATARLVLVVVLTILGSLAGVFIGLLHSPEIILIFLGFLFVVDFILETCLICFFYGTSTILAVLFFISLLAVHFILGAVLTGPFVQSRVVSLVSQFVDQKITPQLQDAVAQTKHDLAEVSSARDQAQSNVTDLQNRLAQAQTDQEQFRKQIEEKKNSEAYLFSHIARMRAQGDWTGARDQLTLFLARFPNGSLANPAREQLAGVNSDLAAQEAQEKQAEADAESAVAQARADLLARAGKGEATLSEMHEALVGKTRAEIKALFGEPTETASDCWGYAPQMILNPLTNEKHGLTIYFSEGIVQSVDYYYGNGASK